MTERFILPGAMTLEPLQQGKLSSFCGIYAILNAIQLALYPQQLSKNDLQSLYQHAVEILAANRQLKGFVNAGIGYKPWRRLLIHLIQLVNDVHSATLKPTIILTGSASLNRKLALSRLKRTLQGGAPVTTIFNGHLNHSSVICGFTANRLLLFDSTGRRWIAAQKLGLGEFSGRKHWLLAAYTFAIVDDW